MSWPDQELDHLALAAPGVSHHSPSGRTDGGFRLYTEDDVDKILVIRRMKPLGFSLDEMKSLMADIETLRDPTSADAALAAARTRLVQVQADAAGRRDKLARQLEMADDFIGILTAEAGKDADA
jgi:DNA-binding transcriptional MerR regulator